MIGMIHIGVTRMIHHRSIQSHRGMSLCHTEATQ